mgnify:CR=1 FL=1
MIEMKNIYKSFGKDHNERKLFEDFSFKISKGDMVAIMGKSGSGKTTLLNIIGGLESIDKGVYLFNGKDVSKFSEKELLDFRRKNISYIFQNFALINEYSIMDNILLPLRYRYNNVNKKTINNARDLLKKLDIAYVENQKIENLSGGEKQRIAIARSLISNTNVILADEPTGALDEKSGHMIMELFKQMKNIGKTIIIVTHDIDVAKKCDYIINI